MRRMTVPQDLGDCFEMLFAHCHFCMLCGLPIQFCRGPAYHPLGTVCRSTARLLGLFRWEPPHRRYRYRPALAIISRLLERIPDPLHVASPIFADRLAVRGPWPYITLTNSGSQVCVLGACHPPHRSFLDFAIYARRYALSRVASLGRCAWTRVPRRPPFGALAACP